MQQYLLKNKPILPLKTWKNHSQKLPPFFSQYCQPAKNQPISHFLYHKDVSLHDFYIMTLVTLQLAFHRVAFNLLLWALFLPSNRIFIYSSNPEMLLLFQGRKYLLIFSMFNYLLKPVKRVNMENYVICNYDLKVAMYWRSVNYEMYFWCLQFSQKTNENNSTWGTIVVKINFFVRFLAELKIPKRHFEINWPRAVNFCMYFEG